MRLQRTVQGSSQITAQRSGCLLARRPRMGKAFHRQMQVALGGQAK